MLLLSEAWGRDVQQHGVGHPRWRFIAARRGKQEQADAHVAFFIELESDFHAAARADAPGTAGPAQYAP